MSAALPSQVVLVEPTASGGLAAHVRMEREILRDAGVQILEPRRRIAPSPGLGDLATILELRSLLRPRSGDILQPVAVHAHGLRAGALSGLARGPRGGRPRLVVTLHNRVAGSRGSRIIGRALLRLIRRRADIVLAVSPDLQEQAQGVPRVLSAIIASPRPDVGPSVAPTASVGEDTAGQVTLLAVGRLAPQKGFEDLLDAVGILHRTGIPLVLRIAGDGPLRPELENRIAQEGLPVRLLGHREDVQHLLAEADLVVSAARWEGQPVFLQEAIIAGAAIIATDAGGTRLVTQDAATLVPPEDPPALAAAISRLEDPRERDASRERARIRARTLPTREDMSRQLLAVLLD